MKKFRTFGAVCLAAAAITMSGAGLAQAVDTPTTPTAPATGSSYAAEALAKILSTGSAVACPGGKCPK
ncbi:hypothetical protein [Nocardia sp. NPDC049149]|uniref:hypothetical protein n=1 Tax=Nocardia sp. NPDC049149 TaxID=3364315 RepID=UPI00371BE4AB